MIWLWIAAALISAGAAALIVHRAARLAAAGAPENPSLAVYRRQMAEIDQLADRGLLAEPERRGIRAEAGRRLLAAAAQAEAPLRTASPGTTLILASLAPIAALALYLAVGAPQAPDQPFAERLAAWANTPPDELSAPELAALMRAAADKMPGKVGPLYYLANYELASDQPLEASQALSRAIALAPGRAYLWDLKGEVDTVLADGALNADARRDFARALALDPHAPWARINLAADKISHGDVAGGLADWRATLAVLPASDPRHDTLAAAIAQVQATGKLPSASAQAEVGQPQIQAMVDGLAARLKVQPDDPAGWARLIRAYTVLGESAQRGAALAQARRLFAGRAEVLKALDAAQTPAG